MKVTTNKILIFFGIIALVLMACLPVSIFAMPLLQQGQPSQANSAATLQAIVSQTMIAMTQNAPSPTPTLYVLPSATPVPATSTPVPTATGRLHRICDPLGQYRAPDGGGSCRRGVADCGPPDRGERHRAAARRHHRRHQTGRGVMKFNPTSKTTIHAGDVLIALGETPRLNELEELALKR